MIDQYILLLLTHSALITIQYKTICTSQAELKGKHILSHITC